MKRKEAKEIIDCLGQERTLFPYFKDRYACLLLADAVRAGRAIRDLAASRFAKLLHRPAIRTVIGQSGDGRLDADRLLDYWPAEVEQYLLTLGIWGPEPGEPWRRDWFQMGRRGHNLVLQLNFSNQHKEVYRDLLRHDCHSDFSVNYHPIARPGFDTLAWARMDIDLNSGEALIEEIQTDWIRNAKYRADMYARFGGVPSNHDVFGALSYGRVLHEYVEQTLAIHALIWSEAMLAAALWFLTKELGIRRIFYYDHETGILAKGMERAYAPPRSLYRSLPKKFCFELDEEMPQFLRKGLTRPIRRKMTEENCRLWQYSHAA